MAIPSITNSYAEGIGLRQLRVLDTVIRVRNLSRAAEALGLTQPALSKTLKNLRDHFSDPLLIRVGNSMQPTPLALEMAPQIRDILNRVTSLNATHRPFDPANSSRIFTFCVVDSGVVRIVPLVLRHLRKHAPHIRLNVLPLDIDNLEAMLEAGQLDFAMGSYPAMSKKIRRQHLWSVEYVSLLRKDHPRAKERLTETAFMRERHVLVSTAGTGHAHERLERLIEAAVPAQNIVCRVPSFLSAAVIASQSDVIVTVPGTLAQRLAPALGLVVARPGIRLPRIDVSQHWHARFHREAGSVWIRKVFAELFADPKTQASPP